MNRRKAMAIVVTMMGKKENSQRKRLSHNFTSTAPLQGLELEPALFKGK